MKPIQRWGETPPLSSRTRVSLIALGLSGASVLVSLPADLGAQTPTESVWRWRGAVSVHKQIQVLAVRGLVRVEGYDGDAVEVVARRQSSEVDPEVVQITLKETANQFQIITEYPPPPLGPPRECLWYDAVRGNFWDYFVTVDLTLRVPREQSISVHTYSGDISAAHLESSVVVSTNDGTIRLEHIEGEIEARAEGDIVADLRQGSPRPGSIHLSVNGGTADIIVRPLERLRVDGRLIVPDVTKPLPIVRAEGPLPVTIVGTLEDGGRILTVRVKRGAVWLSTSAPTSPR